LWGWSGMVVKSEMRMEWGQKNLIRGWGWDDADFHYRVSL